jgi:hypothetical protein
MLKNSPLNTLDGKPVTVEEKSIASTVCSVEDAILNLAVNTTFLINSFNRAHQMFTIHGELYSKMWQTEVEPVDVEKHRQNCLPRLVSLFEQQRLSLENRQIGDTDDSFSIERPEIQAEIVAEAVAWHKKAHRSGKHSSTAATAVMWHASFCRILADRAATLESLTTSVMPTTSSNVTAIPDIANVFVSIRQALQQISKLHPITQPTAAEQAEELTKRVLELQFHLVHEHSLHNFNEDKEEDDSNSDWMIPAGADGGVFDVRGVLRSRLSLTSPQETTIKEKQCSLDMTTVAAQHLVATESVAKLELLLKGAEMQVAELNEKLTSTALKLGLVQAENHVLRQEQVAAKEANAALQCWLESANNKTEAVEKIVQAQTADLSQAREMHAVEVAHLEYTIETLQQQVEDTEAMLRSDAGDYADAIYTLENQVETLQKENGRLEEQIEEFEAAKDKCFQPIKLEINVFLARELELEKARNAELQEQAINLEEHVASVASELEILMKFQKEQSDAAEKLLLADLARKSELQRLEEYGFTIKNQRIAKIGLAAWRLSTQRSKKLDALYLQKRYRARFQVFSAWESYTKSSALLRTLNTAAVEAAKFSLMQKTFAAWRSTTADLKQQIGSELPRNDPRVHEAAEIFHKKYHITPFQAWRNCAQSQSMQNKALVVLSAAQREARILKEAFALWRDVTAMQLEEFNEFSCGVAARNVLLKSQTLRGWQKYTRKSTAEAVAVATALGASRRGMLSKTFTAWDDYCAEQSNKRSEEAHIEECEALAAKQRERAFRQAEEKAESRATIVSLALQRHIFSIWRTEVSYNKHVDAISTWCASSMRRQLLLRSLGGWRSVIFSNQVEELAHQKGQVEASLRTSFSDIALKNQEIEEVNVSRLQALSRVEELEDNLIELEDNVAVVAREASLLAERLQESEDARLAAKEYKVQAVLGAEAAVATEQEARRAAEIACQRAQKERDDALSRARLSQSEATNAMKACQIAENRAQDAEESRIEAEIVAIEALESVEAAAAACERLAEECAGLHIALNEATQRYNTLKERYAIATETIGTLEESQERCLLEQKDLKQQLKVVQQRWKDAVEEKEIAESDAHVAMRQSQRLAEMLELNVQHQEHPLALMNR